MTMMELAKDAFQGYRFAGREEENDTTILKMQNETGNGTMRCYTVLPGIMLSFNSLCMETCYQQVQPVPGFLSINYCKKGCYEFELKDRERYFLGENDLIMSSSEYAVITNSWLPQGVYEGISLMVNVAAADEWLKAQAAWARLDITKLEQSLSGHGVVKLANPREKIRWLFDELYGLSAQAENPGSILKVLDILLWLGKASKGDAASLERFSPAVIQGTEEVHRYLTDTLTECKLTVDELCSKFHVAKTSFQNCFKALYGQSPAEYIRRERMTMAANLMLEEPKMTIGAIAIQVGYENPSKFAAAFRTVMHEGPLEYRKRHFISDVVLLERKRARLE